MLHPAISRALATAYIEDRQRAAARGHNIRLARRAVHEPRVAAASIVASDPRRLRQANSARLARACAGVVHRRAGLGFHSSSKATGTSSTRRTRSFWRRARVSELTASGRPRRRFSASCAYGRAVRRWRRGMGH
jgi:hypothetical protein